MGGGGGGEGFLKTIIPFSQSPTTHKVNSLQFHGTNILHTARIGMSLVCGIRAME